MTHTPSTCTVFVGHEHCGKPAVWSNGEFAECAKHVQDVISLSKSSKVSSEIEVGKLVEVRVYGTGPRVGRVLKLGTKNARVNITLNDGREKVITRPISELTPYSL